MEENYTELGIYIFFLGLIVQSLYRIFDPLIDFIKSKITGILKWLYIIKPVTDESMKDPYISVDRKGRIKIEDTEKDDDDGFENDIVYNYQPPPYEDIHNPHPQVGYHRPDREVPDFRDRGAIESKPTWKDLVIPPVLGLGVAWLFYPLTVFDYLPFQPNYPYAAYIITAFIISRIANMEHDTVKTIGKFFMGVSNKFYYR